MPIKKIILNERLICDLELLLNNSFFPLTTFMNFKEWACVCKFNCLTTEEIFPLPVLLFVEFQPFYNQEIILLNKYNTPLAKLIVNSFFQYSEQIFNFECNRCYKTTNILHPYVKYLKENGLNKYCISGKLIALQKYPNIVLETKQYLSNYNNIIGFQTRNPIHKAHFHLTLNSIEKINNNDKTILFVQPIKGVTQINDIPFEYRHRCYEEILKKYKNHNINVYLSYLNLSMRMAGPREALLHALIRQNYGCTHFIIGRNHASPSDINIYKNYDAHEYCKKYENKLNIKLLYMDNILYNSNDKKYYEEKKFPLNDIKYKINLSGSLLRDLLNNNQDIPFYLSFSSVIDILKTIPKKPICFYIIGPSGSGKTTYGLKLYNKLKYKDNSPVHFLDADEVRNNINMKLTFSKEDRSQNVRNIGWLCSILLQNNINVICCNIAPYKSDREYNKKLIEQYGEYKEIYIKTPFSIRKQRDIKNVYKNEDCYFEEPEEDLKNTIIINNCF